MAGPSALRNPSGRCTAESEGEDCVSGSKAERHLLLALSISLCSFSDPCLSTASKSKLSGEEQVSIDPAEFPFLCDTQVSASVDAHVKQVQSEAFVVVEGGK